MHRHRMSGALAEPERITFEQAITDTATRTRSLLLGNGFSINAREAFKYPSLFARSGPFSEPVAALFRDMDTMDFERVLDALRQKLEDTSAPPAALQEWKRQEDEVRAGFIQAIQRVHPDNAALMGPDESNRCISFLEHFVGRRLRQRQRGRIYTTNYDLLLYWMLARSERRLDCYDSHHSPVHDKRYGVWKPEKTPGVVYLHGALHLYDMSDGGQGMLRNSGGQSLIEQARARLERGSFPVIVSEGTSKAKSKRIERSAYLKWGAKFLTTGLRDRNGVLFTYGHSLDDRDAHILEHIGTGGISAVYIGAYGGLDANEVTIRKWMEVWRRARGLRPLGVYVYDTKTYSPWVQ